MHWISVGFYEMGDTINNRVFYGYYIKDKSHLGKPQNKVLLLMAGPLRPNPPSSLMAVEVIMHL